MAPPPHRGVLSLDGPRSCLEGYSNHSLTHSLVRGHLPNMATHSQALLAARARFVHCVIGREISISGTPRSHLDERLHALGFEPHIGHVETTLAVAASDGAERAVDEESGDGGGGSDGDGEGAKGVTKPFEYLLSMPIASLTDERVKALQRCDLGD